MGSSTMVSSFVSMALLGFAQAALPSTYYASYVKGKLSKSFKPNTYGCPVGWYTDNSKRGYPYCPGNTMEVHSDFSKLNAKIRDNKGFKNHVSCMSCTEFGSSSQVFLGKTFKMVCHGDGMTSTLKELFSDALYGSNTFSFKADGSFSFPNGAGSSGLYQRWTAGTGAKMVWTTHHDMACSGICDLRYTLVDAAAGFGSSDAGAVWFKLVNYYEIGKATCNVELVKPSRRLNQIPESPPLLESSSILV